MLSAYQYYTDKSYNYRVPLTSINCLKFELTSFVHVSFDDRGNE